MKQLMTSVTIVKFDTYYIPKNYTAYIPKNYKLYSKNWIHSTFQTFDTPYIPTSVTHILSSSTHAPPAHHQFLINPSSPRQPIRLSSVGSHSVFTPRISP